MDVQSESSETPPCDPQPPGKIRKAFKLFGKRKPGSIFSIRGKGEGNNKSPIDRSKTVDGLTESTAAESELEKDKEPEKEQEPEVSQREEQEPEEEPLGDDGDPSIPSAGHPSTSSMTSAKSLSFLMKLQRSRQGGADRRFHTESQPTVRQRRGLKGLFGSMGWNQREEASDEADTPPSPLLMSSRTNSVEIIKEDITFTSRPAPHILDVPEPEPGQESPVSSKSPTVQESSASSPPETTALSAATYSVTGSNEDVPPPLPTTEPPPLDPAVDRLRLLLADISSLISFDSLTGCGDITAEVEAEWGKASTTVGTGPGTKGAVVVEGGERNASLNRGEDMTSRNGMDVWGARNNSPNREEKLHVTQNETHMVPQGPPTEKKTPPVREAWLSKIPVCGGGRVGKLPLRESQPTDNKGSWDPPITGHEEGSQRPSLRNGVSKDTISNSSAEAEVEASLPPVKHSPEESRHLRQPTVYRSIPRDSKIPVKLGVQSNIPVPQGTKEPPRSKIPLSKVPVRRIGNKLTATTAASAQIRK
ncbi:APC membrane recruitment protein 2-like [Coregonus clupeaformis]|uniref:APC membrane recruitment protein 2-like n=1 Tax=Coregonus clupeaformis TaxID=59861 RepID=UPI001E1C92F8|nr:APC membrane recruitment protein 2-like [Coregonus clupeaformis]